MFDMKKTLEYDVYYNLINDIKYSVILLLTIKFLIVKRKRTVTQNK